MSSLADARLSVLDTSPIVQGSTARTALCNTVDLALLTDALGYHRYWVPEHHSMRGVASTSPAVLVGQLAAVTTRIRVGSGGVLLYHHAPLVVAEQFGTLEALHPGRVDLGIGRSLGGTKRTAQIIRAQTERMATPFEDQLGELLDFIDPPEDQTTWAIPAMGNTPPVWILGSTDFSARMAGQLGLAYAFALHLNPAGVGTALALYRESFRPSSRPMGVLRPAVLVSVSVIVADTDERARWLAGPSQRKVFGRMLGERILLPSPREAAAYPYTDDDRAVLEQKFADAVIGSSDTVAKRLQALLDETDADELMVTTQVYDHADRRRSYELLAELAELAR